MQPLLFFSRVAFICNICFILTIVLHYVPGVTDSHLNATILVLGFLVAVILNIAVNLFIIVVLLLRKPLWKVFPRWLVIVNSLILVPQLIFFFA